MHIIQSEHWYFAGYWEFENIYGDYNHEPRIPSQIYYLYVRRYGTCDPWNKDSYWPLIDHTFG